MPTLLSSTTRASALCLLFAASFATASCALPGPTQGRDASSDEPWAGFGELEGWYDVPRVDPGAGPDVGDDEALAHAVWEWVQTVPGESLTPLHK
ncbi:MAG: hypothetical protein ACK4N5_12520, partial [Myxococcales bacterium]